MVGFVAFSFSLWFLCHSCVAEVLGVSFQEQRLLVVVGTAQIEHAHGPCTCVKLFFLLISPALFWYKDPQR